MQESCSIWPHYRMRFGTTLNDGTGFTEFEIELSYLTGGAGTVRGGCAHGKLMDWNYKATANEIGHVINRLSRDDLSHIPIERARARESWYLLAEHMCSLAGYNWSVQARAHESVPLYCNLCSPLSAHPVNRPSMLYLWMCFYQIQVPPLLKAI